MALDVKNFLRISPISYARGGHEFEVDTLALFARRGIALPCFMLLIDREQNDEEAFRQRQLSFSRDTRPGDPPTHLTNTPFAIIPWFADDWERLTLDCAPSSSYPNYGAYC